MYILRLTQTILGQDNHRVEVSFEGEGLARQTVTSYFQFNLSAKDQEDFRWYFEDYLQHPIDPAPKIAERIEQQMFEVGTELFRAIFQSNDDARDLWSRAEVWTHLKK